MLAVRICVGVLLIILVQQSEGGSLGSACSDHGNCSVKNSECDDHVCACKSGFMAAEEKCVEGSGTMADRAILMSDLLSSLNNEVAPDGPHDGPVVVKHAIMIQRVASLENGVLTLQVWEDMRWNDPRLRWDPSEYNISLLQIPSRDIWQPDILMLNSAEEYTGHASGDVLAVVKYDGSVTFIPPRITRSFCQFDEGQLFEKNEVSCGLQFMSWVHNVYNLDLQIGYQPEISFNENPDWTVIKTSAEKHVKVYSCCPDAKYADIEYTVDLKRVR